MGKEMTTKSIQQRAEEYVQTTKGIHWLNTSEVEAGYTAGATDERRELGKIILEMVQRFENNHKYDEKFRGFIGSHPMRKHAELIATLREELK